MLHKFLVVVIKCLVFGKDHVDGLLHFEKLVLDAGDIWKGRSIWSLCLLHWNLRRSQRRLEGFRTESDVRGRRRLVILGRMLRCKDGRIR